MTGASLLLWFAGAEGVAWPPVREDFLSISGDEDVLGDSDEVLISLFPFPISTFSSSVLRPNQSAEVRCRGEAVVVVLGSFS